MASYDARPSIRYSLGFRVLEGLVFAPFTAWVGQVLQGQVVVDSTAIVGFFLSPRGFAAALISATIFLTVRLMENAGLSVLVAAQKRGARPTAWSALKYVLVRSRALIRATWRILGFCLALLTPVALAAAFLAHRLLVRHDINYYLQAKPTEFIGAAALLSVMALITIAIGLWMALRWRWVIQVLMFESDSVSAAFSRSAKLARPVWTGIAARWVALGGLNLLLGVAAAWSGRLFLPLILHIVGEGTVSMGFALGALWVTQGLIGAFFMLVGSIYEAHVFTEFYFRAGGHPMDGLAKNLTAMDSKRQRSAWAPAAAALVLVVTGGVMGSIWGTAALLAERPLIIVAHRASTHDAPENTVPAIRQAIRDGAAMAEIDIQLSRDGVVVVAHDSDFSRTAGVAQRVANLTWAEIQRLDVGRAFSATLGKTRPARLEEVLEAARGQISLNIELKHYHGVDGELEKRAVRLVEQSGMVKSVVMQSLEYESIVLVRRLNPAIPIGYLMSVNARRPEQLSVDFLSVEMSRVDARFLRLAHREGHQVYVWTVDDDQQMEKALALGVDGLITNRSVRAVEYLKQWNALSLNEKALRRLRFWLAR